MAQLTDEFLKANAIINLKEQNKVFCSICNRDDNCGDWRGHIKKDVHTVALESFNETFENLDVNACCKICKSRVEWDMIKAHGKSHMIVPWHKPADTFKTFYENHTLKFNDMYHCCLCDELFQEWSMAYKHLGKSKHQNIIQGIRQTAPTRGNKVFYRYLITSGFVPGLDETVMCRFCDEAGLRYDMTIKHINELKHETNISKYVDKIVKEEDGKKTNARAKKQILKEIRKAIKHVTKSSKLSTPVETQIWAKIAPADDVAASANRRMIPNFFLEPEATVKIPEETNSRKEDEEEEMPKEAPSPDQSAEVSDTFQDMAKMAQPTEEFLKANAIISLKEPNKVFCSICNMDENCRDWMGHIEKDVHIAALQSFNETFENLDVNACCKICKSRVEWDMIKTHGKVHMIVPWHKPADTFKTFYENHTLKFGDMYHCCLCDEPFQEWSMAYMHLRKCKHQNLVQEIRQTVPTRGNKAFYRDLIASGFVPGLDGTVTCRFCDKAGLGYDVTIQHINESKHETNISKYVDKFVNVGAVKKMDAREKKKMLKEIRKDMKRVTKSSKLLAPVETQFWEKIAPADNVTASANRRMICNLSLEPEASVEIPEEPNSREEDEEEKVPEEEEMSDEEKMPEEAQSPDQSAEGSDTFKDMSKMGQPTEEFLKANAIISLKEPNKVFCSICNMDENCRDWMGHIEKDVHIAALESFNETFENLDESACCKICKSEVEWDMIKTHGKVHMIVPWYKPDDNFKTFYENHTLKFGDMYHCCLCDELFQEWSMAYMHLGKSKHQSIIQEIQQTVPTRGNKVFYRDLIASGFVPGLDGTVTCRFCDTAGLGYHMTIKHIKEPKHAKNKSKYVNKFVNEEAVKRMNARAKKKMLKEIKKDVQRVAKSSKLSAPVETQTWNKISPDDNAAASANRRMICNFFLEPEATAEVPEVANSSKEDKEEKVPEEEKMAEEAQSPDQSAEVSDTLKDMIVDYVVSGSNPLCEEARAKSVKSKKGKKSQATSDRSKPYCLICRCEIAGYPSVMDHVQGIPHANSRARYRCEEIFPVEGDLYYYCRSCDCTVTGFDNVYRHVIGDFHKGSIDAPTSAVEKDKPIPKPRKAQKNIVSRMEIARGADDSVSSNENFMYIVRRNAKKSFCKICDESEYAVSSKNIREHVAGDRHKLALIRYGCDNIVEAANGYRCRCCECELADLENVYLHVKDKRHMSSLIKVARKDEPNRTAKQQRSLRQSMFDNNFENPSPTSSEPNYRSLLAASRIECNGTSVQPELNSMRSSMASELSRLLEFSAINSAKNMPRPQFDERTNRKFKKIKCNLCELKFDDSTQLHVHMAGHFVDEFARSTRSCCTNGVIENDSNNDRNALLGRTESPQSDGDVFSNNADGSSVNLSPDGDDQTNSNGLFGCQNNGDAVEDIEARFSAALRETAMNQNNDDAEKQLHWPRKANLNKVIELLDFDDDHIFDMADKMTDIERGTMLCLTIDSNTVYCLVCQETVENTLQNYLEHLSSVDHCENLEMMEQDCELFEDYGDQFSDMDLAHEYMQEISDDAVQCLICDRQVDNDEPKIEEHIYEEIHSKKSAAMRESAMRIFDDIKSRIRCDWYSVHQYWCVICKFDTTSEVSFVTHLKKRKHRRVLEKPENEGRKMIFDFCAACGILWYGYRCTYAYHSEIESHKWLTRDGYYARPGLPILAKNLLAAPEKFVEDRIKILDENRESERAKEEALISDMETAVKMRFSRAKAYVFGSRVSGLGTPDSDIDVYLDCCNKYDGNDMSQSQMVFYMISVRECLINDAQKWDVEELLTNCRSPIIRAAHRATGLYCDISFQNGLSVENTKLIKTLNKAFPMCRKLILFLKQWLAHCELSGSKGISNYALYWYVIFYLQKESILPSIATLVSMRKKSRIIAGWEVGISQDFSYNELESNYSVKEFLTRFFKFYADFDFRYYVASPLLGEELEKRDFATPSKLPEEMALYVDYLRYSKKNPEPFRIDSVMCIQDPIDLQHNLTKAVNKVYLNRFRTYCSKSLDLLCST